MTTTGEAIQASKKSRRSSSTHRIRRSLRSVIIYASLLLLCVAIILPVGWMITVALKPDNLPVFTIPPEWYPTEHWNWNNFLRVLTNPQRPFMRYALNTMIIVTGNIIGTVLSCSLVAYPFARMNFRGRDILFTVLIITMLIPWQVLMIPQFLMFHRVGWYGTYLPLIVPSFFGNAFYIFLIRQYMLTLPKELDDAARIDGCNWFQTYWHVILPLAKPVLTVVAVFVFLGEWNDLLGPLIYLDDGSKFTIAIGLANLATRANPSLNLVMAANLMIMIPPIIIYFFAQERLIGGIASVGLKG